MLLRLFLMLPAIITLYVYHTMVVRIMFIDVVRRYITCVVNLVNIRYILLVLGFLQFENSSYKFFERSSVLKFTLRSGYIGIANHTNIVDFLFYTYLMSPLYVRIVVVEMEDGKVEYMYSPLSHIEAF